LPQIFCLIAPVFLIATFFAQCVLDNRQREAKSFDFGAQRRR
jgi:hypothetical protein